MAYIKTLTVNGSRYTVRDPEAAHIDNSTVGVDVWSSENTVDMLCPVFSESGGIAVCKPVTEYPLGIRSELLCTQSGAGTPNPGNIRPISGCERVKLYQTGENLLNLTAVSKTERGVTFTVAGDGTITTGGTATEEIHYDLGKTQVITGEKYTIVGCPKGGSSSSQYSIYVAHEGEYSYDTGNGVTFTAVANKNNTIRILIRKGTNVSNLTFRPVVHNLDSRTYVADFGQTVYGGSYDWESGVLTIDKGVYTVTGQEKIVRDDSVTDHMFLLEHGQDTALFAPCICSHFAGTENEAASGLAEEAVSAFTPYFAFNSETLAQWDDPADYFAQQYAAGTPVQVVYSLMQPVTVQYTPWKITALSGINTLLCDAGTLVVSGRKDPVALMEDLTNAVLALGGNI